MTTSTHPWQTSPMNELDDVAEAVDRLEAAVERGIEPIERNSVELALVDVDYRQPWDRAEQETGYEYQMFLVFRDLGMRRTTKGAWEAFVSEHVADGEKSPSLNKLYQISNKNRWKERAFQWDQNEEAQYQLARSEAIRDMANRHERDITDAIDGLMTPIRALQHRIENDPDFIGDLSQASAAKLVDMANKASRTIPSLMSAERLARGMPTEIVGGTVEHQLVTEVDRDQIGEILEILDRAGALNVGGGDIVSGEIVDAEVVDVHSLPADGDDG